MSFRFQVRIVALGALVAAASVAGAAGTPEQRCQAAKNRAAGAYATCRQKAEAALATSGDAMKYTAVLGKCDSKLTGAWQKAIAKAASAGATCLDDPLTVGDFQTVINVHTDNVATALGGGGLDDCPADLATCEGDLATCDGDLMACQATPQSQRLKTGQSICYNAAGGVIACAGTGQDGELQKGLARSYTDNGDGTITDNRTGLMWEKHGDDGSVHDQNNTYTWADAFAVKIAALNSGSFAGHNDWRLPNLDELVSIVSFGNSAPAAPSVFNSGCIAGCTVLTCSCTGIVTDVTWTSDTVIGGGGETLAWYVNFSGGNTLFDPKSNTNFVRAVRGGS